VVFNNQVTISTKNKKNPDMINFLEVQGLF
jgi:hypothetical protein